jgi:glycosyltransferase involved in cell wall biosynthesis
MNIVISTLVTSSNITGVGNYTFKLIEGLQKVNSEHEFYIIVNQELEPYLKLYKRNFHKVVIPLPHHPRYLLRPIYFIWQNFIDKFLINLKIDVVHMPNPIPLFRKGEMKYVTTVHDVAEFSGKRHTTIRRWMRILATSSSVKISDKILTVSDFSKREILKATAILGEAINVCYPGVAIGGHDLNNSIFPNRRPFFLHVGGTGANKNVNRIINAFNISGLHTKADIYLVGEYHNGKTSRRDIERFRKKGVHFTGYVTDKKLMSFYSQAIALVYPSLYEGFGLPILEAMSLGVPVITSNITSMPEVAGDAALLVNPESEEEIAEAMQSIIENKELRDSLIEKGYKRASIFSWEETAKQTLRIYERAYQSFNLQE